MGLERAAPDRALDLMLNEVVDQARLATTAGGGGSSDKPLIIARGMDINSLDPAPDVIVHTGDIVHNGLQDEYAQAASILAKASAPAMTSTGTSPM